MPIEFDEDTKNSNGRLLYAKFQKSSNPPSIILFLIKRRIVRNEASARRLLLVFVIFVLLLSLYLFTKGMSGPQFIDNLKISH